MSEAVARMLDEPELCYVNAANVDATWDVIAPHIEAACDETLTPEMVRDSITDREALAWVILNHGILEAVAVTRIIELNGRRWLDVVTLGGEGFKTWCHDLHQGFEAYARENGCCAMKATCRPGLARWLKEGLDWKRKQIIMEYPIDG